MAVANRGLLKCENEYIDWLTNNQKFVTCQDVLRLYDI
jgi:hypothetical protein